MTILVFSQSPPVICYKVLTFRVKDNFGTWSEDKLNYTVDLKQGILFQDGTQFNASAVKWSFDRLAYFMNITGDLPEGQRIADVDSLYRWPDWTPIINRVDR